MKIFYLFLLISISVFAQDAKLKIVSVNVWSGLDYHGILKMGEYETTEKKEARFNLLLNELKAIKPDVIFLQEVNPVAAYSARLADSLNFDEIHQVCNAGIKIGSLGFPINSKEGITILTDKKLGMKLFDIWKLEGSFGVFGDVLTIHFDESNFALVGKILVDNTPVYLVNVHLSATVPADSVLKSEYETFCKENSIGETEIKNVYTKWDAGINRRNYELENLNEQLKKLPHDFPFVIGGDFNMAPEIKELKNLITSNNFLDTFEKNNSSQIFTWYPLKNENISYSTRMIDAAGNKLNCYDLLNSIFDLYPRRIDYLFLSHHFRKDDILSNKIIFDSTKNNIHPSDHFGIYSEINLKEIISSTPKEFLKITSLKDKTFEPFPIISYDTDVGFGYGAKAFLLNQLNLSESFDLTFFNSTKGERWYRFVFSVPDFEFRQGKIYPLAFDFVVDYDKYIKNNFFGIGNNSKFQNREYYTKEPLEINLNFSRGFSNSFVAQLGLKYKYIRNFNIADTSEIWKLSSKLSLSKINYISTLINLRYDTRNSFINPSEGIVLQCETEFAFKNSFTNISFNRFSGLFQYYTTLFYPKTVFAFRSNLQSLTGNDLPIQILLPLGGNNTLRGYPQDRFLDNTTALVNAELRFPIFRRFGGTIGMDAGKVWNSISKIDLNNWASSPVAGLRFYMDTFVVRLDVGFGKETTGVYFNFGQIF
ncbi:MAG: BamA/TamA family outer membrane protein [Bacteroidetes bacterium]|nr:BamA/TamA family outer membrane protein [Bacteroidota bacterium]